MNASNNRDTGPERPFSVLLLELNGRLAEGRDDAVPDWMDVYWSRMTEEQRQRMRWPSVDLDQLAESRYAVKDGSPEQEEWAGKLPPGLEAQARGNVEPLLALLRADGSFGVPGGVAFLQGRLWDALGFPEVALRFLEYSERFVTDQSNRHADPRQLVAVG